MRIVTAMAAAEPQAFLGAAHERARDLEGVVVHCANPSRPYPCFVGDGLVGKLELRVMFLTDKVRFKIDALPVVDDEGRLLGILTPTDLLAALRRLDGLTDVGAALESQIAGTERATTPDTP
jgi:hypothetical protein